MEIKYQNIKYLFFSNKKRKVTIRKKKNAQRYCMEIFYIYRFFSDLSL